MDTNAILSVTVRNDTRTVALLDKFESINENGSKKYKTLLLEDAFYIRHLGHRYKISLYMQRKPLGSSCIKSSLTFSDLKRELFNHIYSVESNSPIKIVNEVLKAIAEVPNLQELQQTQFFFDLPVQFNAQNSSNRSGYGNRYRGEELVYQGTQYGETTTYVFVGAQCQRWY